MALVTLPAIDHKAEAVEAMFDRIAPRYDRLNRVLTFRLDVGWRRKAVAALGLGSGATVLDVACGTGDLCRDLAARGYTPVGLDFSAGMLAAAAVDAPLVRADGAALPVATGSIDGVTCGFALRNFVEMTSVFSEVARVLRAGGRFAALDAAVPSNPLLRVGNAVWFRGAVPLLGRALAHDSAYSYLPKSTAYLPSPGELLTALHAAGFGGSARRTFTGGSVQLLTGTRV